MGHSIAPIPPARYPSIPNKHVIFFRTLMSEIVPDTIYFRRKRQQGNNVVSTIWKCQRRRLNGGCAPRILRRKG